MTIVRLGSPILKVPREKNRRKYLEKMWAQMESLIVYMVERCISEALEVEVSRALGRGAYQPCEQAAFGSGEAYCRRCRSRDRRRFQRNGHYPRFLDTHWGRVSIGMPQVICRCGGAVCIDFQPGDPDVRPGQYRNLPDKLTTTAVDCRVRVIHGRFYLKAWLSIDLRGFERLGGLIYSSIKSCRSSQIDLYWRARAR